MYLNVKSIFIGEERNFAFTMFCDKVTGGA
jgi:hypothetical protein